ncbi:NADH-quinone oxidoreductase subunit J [Vandammella animalimorsus]|uniref:NADH-quinone oxidoreductase subunit J n=1 Tax=Vandammella animalimorsus TaxID=2029117 RepID=A0A2A2AYI1_9BURK|nr:NADH-quinone oxidoreductase subunit J [Vandammella animalimorsus]PAT42709.1 NADH:ubiquinone oxidoreductase subunit J [Vandammella animalimorsus]RRD68088.1 NADH-quinone oxidoreductase subunit J [Comamonadaceae bacterium OH2310_COT-174]
MDVRNAFFYLFAAALLFAALRVITARNPVHAVLYLIFAFSQAAGVWLLMRAEFLAILLVMVYLGAVMVLFLFVVMMLDIRIERMQGALKKNLPAALVILAVVVGQMVAVLWLGFPDTDAAGELIAAQPGYNNTRELGKLMYTEYVLPVQVAGVILLVGMIAAIALTLRTRRDTKAIDPSLQVHVKAEDRMRVVQMPAVRRAPAAGPAQAAQEEIKP